MAQTLKSLDEIRYALDQAAIVAATDHRGIITYVNDKFCDISKYSRQELLGADHRIINSGYHPKEFMRGLWRTIARGQVWRGEIRNRAKDGSFYWVDTTIVPFLDGAGKPRQYLAIRSDITARKQAEAQLREQAALTNLGQLTAIVAHEVRNPLAGLRASLQILEQRCADGRDRDIIAAMVQRIDDLNAKVEDLLLYARPKRPRLQAVDIGALMREVAHSARVATGSLCPPIDVAGGDGVIGAGRPGHVARRAAQRHHERLSGRRQSTGRHRGGGPVGLLPDCGPRPWSGDPGRRPRAHVRAVLHDARRRHRARSGDREAPCRAAQWNDRAERPSRRGDRRRGRRAARACGGIRSALTLSQRARPAQWVTAAAAALSARATSVSMRSGGSASTSVCTRHSIR